jgi:hypothetical protein
MNARMLRRLSAGYRFPLKESYGRAQTRKGIRRRGGEEARFVRIFFFVQLGQPRDAITP